MSKYSSKTIKIERPAAEISDKFSDLSKLQGFVDQLPAEQRDKLGDVRFDTDTISIQTAQVGNIDFKVIERTPSVVKFTAVGAPVPVNLDVNLAEAQPAQTDLSVSFDVQIPMMLRPMVAPHLQKAVDMLADVIGSVAAQ